jgi:dTDP-glucose 4,6-dehydratase/UDP-glucose 4-epimerase
MRAAATSACYGQAFNLGSPEIIDLATLAQSLCDLEPEATWQLVPFPPERKVIDIGDYYSNYSYATELLGWEPTNGLEEGLRRTVEYYRHHLLAYL